MDNETIIVRGAREHNLKNINLELPRNKLIVFTGVSGSGKSSLAFDTLYAEGQRRYVESLSSYARQFLGQLQKPDVDYIAGLSPAISIQQKTAGRNPRSTVGTITEVSDYLRVLYARLGEGHCPKCDRPITAQSREQIVGRVLTLPAGSRFLVLAPVVRSQKGEFKDFFADLIKRGYVRARVDGTVVRMTDDLKLDKKIKHFIEVVVDRLVLDSTDGSQRTRIAEAVEQSLALADGAVIISVEQAKDEYSDLLLSAKYACAHCQVSYEPPSPQLFSFNSPHGMCPECDGLGTKYTFDPDLLVPDPSLSFAGGAVPLVGPFKGMGRWRKHTYEGVGKSLEIDLKMPWNKLSEEHKNLLLHGSGDRHIVWEWKQRSGIWKHGGKWEGVVPQLMSQFKKSAAMPRRVQLEKSMSVMQCPGCHGQRLNPQARAVQVHGKTLVEVGRLPLGDLVPWFEQYASKLTPVQKVIAEELLKEIRARLGFLLNVGLHYLSLDRAAPTLSGGEAQRIRLAGQIGSGLVGVLYILDEPSIGLHPRDNAKLLESLENLRDMGNTVLVVEHDEETMAAADYLVDFGPGPGVRGGSVVAAGTPAEVIRNPASLTGSYMSGTKKIEIPAMRRKGNGHKLRIVNATQNNLKHVTVDIPLGKFVVVTGVSGSGKSSLVNDVLKFGMRNSERGVEEEEIEGSEIRVPNSTFRNGEIEGEENIDKLIDIDQTAIGRTPRSNPATYIKLFDEIRNLYAQMTEAKTRGYKPGRFSFNTGTGRCEACEGNGLNKLEMDFLADVWVTCPVCDGHRFNRETLQVKYRGRSIHDVLEMEVAAALEHFEHVPKIRQMLQTLHDVGLDYIKLGQPSPTLSGGEAQRIKLAKELVRPGTGKTLYILDEPTTGLHFEDVRKLLEVLHGFVEKGNTVLVIEHNLDVIKTADWLIDMGPDGGNGGGEIVAVGTPEQVAKCEASHTGNALRGSLGMKTKAKAKKKAIASGVVGRITHLEVTGASQHNLKNVSTKLPRDKMTVFCGPSGSGKSSLAMDTIYAEGQRRYVESLSSYARQFLGQVQKPRVEQITGLSPAVAIEQKTTSRSPRSTVGTITEIYDYLRILYARLGKRWCPKCQIPIGTQTSDEIIETILDYPESTKLYLLAPIERRGQEKYEAIFDEIRRSGFIRVRIDGKSHNLDDVPAIDHKRKHKVEVVVDRNVIRAGNRTRIAEAVEQALELGKGEMSVAFVETEREEPEWKVEKFSRHLACSQCGTSYEPLNPHNYSFNSPLGWCKSCEGLGVQKGADVNLLIGDATKSLREGAIIAWPSLVKESPWLPFAEAIARNGGFSLDTPSGKLEPSQQRTVLHGTGEAWLVVGNKSGVSFQYKGLFPAVDEASRVSYVCRARLEHLTGEIPCPTCHGSRLRKDAAATRFADRTLGDVCGIPLGDAHSHITALKLSKRDRQIAGEVLREVMNRLQFLVDVGLEYLTLDRAGPTLSGGEAQRIRLASQIGSGLTGVLYVLDEPTIGLHPRDNARLLRALKNLRDLGNTMVLVEHDREVIAAADHLVDFGPGAGDQGGTITASGTLKTVSNSEQSLTGKYLSGRAAIAVPSNRRIETKEAGRRKQKAVKIDTPKEISDFFLLPSDSFLSVFGARQHNLKNVDLHLPLSTLIAITGVSGSGKSSLVHEVLYNTLARRLNRASTKGAAHDEIRGLDKIDKIIRVDQDPLGNSPSSNPATYTGVFDLIRELFARLPESKVRGYAPRRFSFNQKGGRCEACEGMGQKKIEMHFLPDVWVECDTCRGARFSPETLAVQYRGKTISDVLNLRISEAMELFGNIPKIRVVLQTLADVGLGYMALGQPAPTMSGGEAQRVKLAAELARPSTGRTLYLLDEPTTGLHFDDVKKLLDVLQRLVDLGNTVIVVEHNVDVIKSADWLVDLGPEAGSGGGRIVAQGTPEVVAEQFAEQSHTARILKEVLAAGPRRLREIYDAKKALAKAVAGVDIADVGAEMKLPWEADGQKWHTQDRITTHGLPCKWDGQALADLEAAIHELGQFSETNWNHRSVVEIAALKKSHGWFLHAATSHPAYLKLIFRVGRNFTKEATLSAQLNLKPLSDTPGLEGYSRDHRVEVQNPRGPWQWIVITITKREEVNDAKFQSFLKDAIASFHAQLGKLGTDVGNLMPWKIDGEKWHLSEKGFPPGKGVKWDRSLLPAMLKLMASVDADLDIRWDSRDALLFKLPGCTKSWSRWKTKEAKALECRFVGEPGQFNLARVEKFGTEPAIEADRGENGDVLTLRFTALSQLHSVELTKLLKEHAAGFRRHFKS